MPDLIALILAFLLFFSPAKVTTQSDQPDPNETSEETHLTTLFANIPASSFRQGMLAYTDYDLIFGAHPDIEFPPDSGSSAEWFRSPDSYAYRSMLPWIALGVPEFIRFWHLADNIATVTGIDPYELEQSVTSGMPPTTAFWLQGDFDRERIIGALMAHDYELLESDGDDTWTLLCADGDCANGFETNIERRDPAFIFGGDLGRRYPVALDDSIVASASSEADIRAMVNLNSASLLANVSVTNPVQAIESHINQDDEAAISQMLIYKSELAFRTPMPQAFTTITLAEAIGKSANHLVIALYYPDKEDAEEALGALQSLIPEREIRGKAIPDFIAAEMGGTLDDLYIEDTSDGSALLIPIRFETITELVAADLAYRSPMTVFSPMFYNFDMNWLLIDDEMPPMP